MNKKILNKLRNDAGFGYGVAMGLYTHDATEMWVEYDKDGEECWPSREIMEKFAELIVKECMDVLRQAWYDENAKTVDDDPRSVAIQVGMKSGLIQASNVVAKHFGVR